MLEIHGKSGECPGESWREAWDEKRLRRWRRQLVALRLSWMLFQLSYRLARRSVDLAVATVLFLLFLPQWMLLIGIARLWGIEVSVQAEPRVSGGWKRFDRYCLRASSPRLNHFLQKSSFEATPELINVLRGEMSMRGSPAPCIGQMDAPYRLKVRRHSFMPGVSFFPFKRRNFFQSQCPRRAEIDWLAIHRYRQIPSILFRVIPQSLRGHIEL